MQKLFKNAEIPNLGTGEVKFLDFLVEDGKFVEFGKFDESKFCGEVVDLNGGYVLPNFVNVFCNSAKACEMTYSNLDGASSTQCEAIAQLMLAKNILAGAICNDVAVTNVFSPNFEITNIIELTDNDLSNFCNLTAKHQARLFLKVGQSLDELGTIDKQYKKPLSQVLEDFGLLDRKPVIVGGNCFEKDELELLSQYDCDFCLTVGEDGKFGRRPTNVLQIADKFCVGLGSGYNFEIDFFAFMRQILMTQRGLFEDENVISEQEVLQMAIFNGAQILTGERNDIKEGAVANFMVIKNTPTLYDDIFKTLVWEKSKKDVTITVLNGEIVQKNGEIFMKNLPQYDKILEKIVKQK